MEHLINYFTTDDLSVVWKWLDENGLWSELVCTQHVYRNASIEMRIDKNYTTKKKFYRVSLYCNTKMHILYAIPSEKYALYLYNKNFYILRKYAEKHSNPLLYRESLTGRDESIWND